VSYGFPDKRALPRTVSITPGLCSGKSAALLLAIGLITVAPSPSIAAPRSTPTCFGRPATIVGSSDANLLRGTTKADIIVGKGGNDIIIGRQGNDRICGGSGFDRVLGGAGRDKVHGNGGHDYLDGERGGTSLRGGTERDHCIHGAKYSGCELQGLTIPPNGPPGPPQPPPGRIAALATEPRASSQVESNPNPLGFGGSPSGSLFRGHVACDFEGSFKRVGHGLTRQYEPAVTGIDHTGGRDRQTVWWRTELWAWSELTGAFNRVKGPSWAWTEADDNDYAGQWVHRNSGRDFENFLHEYAPGTWGTQLLWSNWIYWPNQDGSYGDARFFYGVDARQRHSPKPCPG
jgi:hypothetical protein